MALDPVLSQRFTDKQTGAILRRAAELQAQEEGEAECEATSLEQLQQAAAELGIKPHLIARAALEVAEGKATKDTSGFWGSPSKIELERIVPYPITEENWPEILAEMRRVTGRVGDTTTFGRSLEWKAISPDVLHVTVSPQGDQSRVTITAKIGEWGVASYALAGMAAFIASFALIGSHPHWSLPVDLTVVTGLVTTGCGLARATYQYMGKSRRRLTKALLLVLENRADPIVTEPLESASYTAQTGPEIGPVQEVAASIDRSR